MKEVSSYDQMEKYSYFGIKTLGIDNDEVWLVLGKLIGFRVDKDIRETKYSQFQLSKKKAIVHILHVLPLEKMEEINKSLNIFFYSLIIGHAKEPGRNYYVKNKLDGKDWAKLYHLEDQKEIDFVKKCMMVDIL